MNEEPQSVNASALLTHIPNVRAKDTPGYLVEYGSRVDDGAMVFHFFAPIRDDTWNEDYQMHRRLESAIAQHFDTTKVSANYEQDMDSFCIIVGGLGAAPDPWPLVERFFGTIDAWVPPEA